MRIAIGADHAGFDLKQRLGAYLRQRGHEVIDVGTMNKDPVDYPDYAEAVAKVILDGHAERGLLICGSGVGASVAANKLPGIRAAVCHDTYSARQGVEHDDMNILVLGSKGHRRRAGARAGAGFSRRQVYGGRAPSSPCGEN